MRPGDGTTAPSLMMAGAVDAVAGSAYLGLGLGLGLELGLGLGLAPWMDEVPGEG